MNFLIQYGYQLFTGTLVTLGAWIMAGLLSLAIGFVLGIASSRYLGFSFLAKLIRVYAFVAKGIPAYVQILIAYFVLPSLLGINISGFVAATLALAFCSSGYITEIVRAGINTIAVGQWEACAVLGYPLTTALRRIIMPQMLKNILPALFGELEQLLKSSSLLAVIGVTELTRTGMNIISRELNPLPVYLTIACIYLCISAVLQLLMIWSERGWNYGRN
jgi:His/Glu/Gln/Arg/opine family amino acid ABC transporter permease subunit